MSALEIVVGIDFGTTYSGASWAINGGERHVHLVDNWPNPTAANVTHHKVPSLLSYNGRGEPVKVGYNVKLGTDPRVLRWSKLLVESLNYDNDMIAPLRESETLLRSLRRPRLDAVSDYLAWIWQSTKENIRMHQGDNWMTMYSLSVILTIPAIWSAKAKARTKRIARTAGLPENTKLVPEPEAAALAAFKDLVAGTTQQTLRVGDAFVVCDAGGGTVDLISYKIRSLHPFSIEECTPGTGGLHGSILIDTSFKNDIRTRIGPRTFDSMPPRRRARIFENFEAVKRSFSGDDREEHILDLPGIRDNAAAGIRDQAIQLTPTMLRTLFDHVCNQVVYLVDNQIENARAEHLRVQSVFLVGGFGSSKYLHRRIKQSCESLGVQVLQTRNSWSAICRGATLWGLENSDFNTSTYRQYPINARRSRINIGYCDNVPFNRNLHTRSERIRDSHGRILARDQMEWLVRWNDRIEHNQEIQFDIRRAVQVSTLARFISSEKEKFSQTLHYCDGSAPPTRMHDVVRELCSIDFEVEKKRLAREKSYREPSSGTKYRDVVFDFRVRLEGASLTFKVLYGGKPVASCKTRYRDLE